MVDATSALKGISYHTPQELMRMVVEGFSELRPKISEAVQGKVGVPIESVRLRPLLPRPGQLVCLAGNYLEPAKPERGEFNAFLKSPTANISCVVGARSAEGALAKRCGATRGKAKSPNTIWTSRCDDSIA